MKVIIGLKGGYGNQLFSYAFGYALSKELDCKLCLDTTLYECGIEKLRNLELLNLNVRYDKIINTKYNKNIFVRKLGINKIRQMLLHGIFTETYIEKELHVFEPEVFNIKQSTFFIGFWQDYRYFEKYKDEIMDMFTPKEERNENVKAIAENMDERNSVSVHIRRGDYVKLGWELPFSYYEEAINKVKGKIPNVVFYIFTDDIDYVKGKIKEKEVIFVQYDSENRTFDDFYLMSKCKHNIISNSTYSWWAAYLNRNANKKVIAPIIKPLWKSDWYPPMWELIEVNKEH